MKELRILSIAACPLPAGRGTPVRIFRLAEALAEIGHKVDVATYHLGEDCFDPGFTIHRIADISWYKRMAAGPSYGKLIVDWHLARKVKQLLNSLEFDVIHAHHYEGLLCAMYANQRTHLPVIFDAHTLLSSELPAYPLGLPQFAKRHLGNIIDGYLPKHSTHVVAVSSLIKKRLIERFDVAESKISVIPNGTEVSFLSGGSSQKNDRPVVLFTGNLGPHQDIEVLLEAFSLLKDRVPKPVLRIVSNDDFARYTDQVNRLGIEDSLEIVTGEFDELPRHLASADVAVNPRRVCDGVPQKLLNYMAAGCPVVSFHGSARHVVHDESAWIAQEPTAACFAKGIDELLDRPQYAMEIGANASRAARDELSWSRAAKDFEVIARRLIQDHE